MQGDVDSSDSAAVAKIFGPQFRPDLAVFQRILTEQDVLQVIFDRPLRSADFGRFTPADQTTVRADLHQQDITSRSQLTDRHTDGFLQLVRQRERFDLGDLQRTWFGVGGEGNSTHRLRKQADCRSASA